MSALPPSYHNFKSNFAIDRYHLQQDYPSKIPTKKNKTIRASFPKKNKYPFIYTLLIASQKMASALAIVSTIGTLSVYLLTVSIPQKWSKEYEKLEKLERLERQLTANNESQKYNLARQAQKANSELSPIKADRVTFLEPNSPGKPSQKQIRSQEKVIQDSYLGY